ncbi:MAG TPA: PAS domain S-box protein [Ignavibacteria bacterium]|nr:PAS domain S-box protein [Ignavibacteria bacterium]
MDYYNLKKEKLIEEILRLKLENELLADTGEGFKFIFENSCNSIIVINDKGKVLNSNKAAKILFGIRDTKRNKISLREFRCSDGSDLQDNVMKSAAKGRFRQEVSISGELVCIGCEVLFKDKNNIICIFSKEKSDANLQFDLSYIIGGHFEFFSKLDAGINIISRDFRIKYSNDSAKKLNSGNQNSANRKCFDIYGKSKQNGQCDKCPVALSFDDGTVHKQIIPLGNSHGDKTYQVTSFPILGSGGEITGAIEYISDTRKDINESAIFDGIFFTKNILDSIPVPIFIKYTDGKYLTCNKEFTRYFNLEEKDILMKNDTELFGEHYAELFAHSDFETIKDGIFEEYLDAFRISDDRPPGCFLIRRTLCKSDGNTSLIIGAATDITETKNIQDELTKQKNYIFNIIENANVMIIGLDLEGNITLFNKMAENITGYSRNEIMGKNYFEYIVPRGKFPGVYESFMHFSHSKVIKYDNYENYIKTKSGEEKYISWRDSATVDGDKVTGIISFGIDLSFSRYERETLRRFTMAAELSESAILIADKSGSVKYINPAFTKITGYSFDETKGRNSLYFKSRMTDSDAFNNVWKKIKSGQNFKGEFKFKKKNGEEYWESNSISSVKDENGQISDIIVIKNDITKYKNSFEGKGKEKISDNIPPAFSADGTRKPNILFAAENDINIKITVSLLKKYFDVDIVSINDEALIKHNAQKYDIVLFDINPQSGKSIFKILNEIRRHGTRKGIPFIAVSNYDVISERQNLINAGFTDYLARPFTKEQLLYIIKKYI